MLKLSYSLNKKAFPSAFKNQANDGGGLPSSLRLSQNSKDLNFLISLCAILISLGQFTFPLTYFLTINWQSL